MKKIAFLFGAALFALSIIAAPVTPAKKLTKFNESAKFVKDPSALEVRKTVNKAKAAAAITITGVEQIAYYASEVEFNANTKLSTYYNFDLFNEEGYYIASGAWKPTVLDTIDAKNAIYGFGSNDVLTWGTNYKDVEEYAEQYRQEGDAETAARYEEIAASWKEQWMKYVVAYDEQEYDGDTYIFYCLKPGTYYFGVEGIDAKYNTTEKVAYAKFEVNWYSVSNLKAEVSEAKDKATISWALPASLPQGSQLYVAVSDNEGNLAYTNYDQQTKTLSAVTSPLVIDVEEGKTYDAAFQIFTANFYEAGMMEDCVFTVGTSTYAPANLKAEVIEEEGDSVRFTWESADQPTAFGIVIYYKSGEYLAAYGYEEGDIVAQATVQSYAIGARLAPGTYTWDVVAYLSDGQYLNYASEYIAGAEFTTEDLGAPVITALDVKTEKDSPKATFTFEVDDNYYEVDDMTFHVSGDITGDWKTTYGVYVLDNLEIGKQYSIKIIVEDPAGNSNPLASKNVEFTAGIDTAVETVLNDAAINKFIRNGQILIMRGNSMFNLLGTELR